MAVTPSSVASPHIPGTFAVINGSTVVFVSLPRDNRLFFLITNKVAIHKLRQLFLAPLPPPLFGVPNQQYETVSLLRIGGLSREEIEQTQLVDPVKSLPSATLPAPRPSPRVAEQHPITQGN